MIYVEVDILALRRSLEGRPWRRQVVRSPKPVTTSGKSLRFVLASGFVPDRDSDNIPRMETSQWAQRSGRHQTDGWQAEKMGAESTIWDYCHQKSDQNMLIDQMFKPNVCLHFADNWPLCGDRPEVTFHFFKLWMPWLLLMDGWWYKSSDINTWDCGLWHVCY